MTLTLASCGPAPAIETQARFALTAAGITYEEGDSYPVNLIFVAPESDPIFDSVTQVRLGQNYSLGEGSLTVHQGDGPHSQRLGNISFDVPSQDLPLEFNDITIWLDGATSPSSHSVGDWKLSATPQTSSEARLEPSGDFILSMDQCGPISGTFTNESGGALRNGAPPEASAGMSISWNPPAGEIQADSDFTIDFDVTCEPAYDLFILSPSFAFESETGDYEYATFPSTMVGFTNMGDDLIQRIAERP